MDFGGRQEVTFFVRKDSLPLTEDLALLGGQLYHTNSLLEVNKVSTAFCERQTLYFEASAWQNAEFS